MTDTPLDAPALTVPLRPAGTAAAPEERIRLLDALRGFALFGILLANIIGWSWGWYAAVAAERAGRPVPAVDQAAQFLHLLLIDGKFYTIFSLLFGIGFALQLARLEGRGADGLAIFRRRLLVLLAIGLIHLVLIWDGDILTLYALLGLTLPFFRGWSDLMLLGLAAALILLPIPGYALVAAAGIDLNLGLDDFGYRIFAQFGGVQGQEQELAWFRRDGWQAHIAWVLSGWPFRIGGLIESWRIPKVLGIMLIGLWVGRRLVDGRLLADRRLLRRVALAGFAVGLPVNLAYAALGGLDQDTFLAGFAATIAYAVGVVPLGLAYAASFVLLWDRAAPVLGMLAAPGRMALTNYLMQSLFGIAIFYGIGLGLAARLPVTTVYAIAIAIFAVQILLSNLWLSHFRQGPMERLWRLGTYGRRQPAPAG
jgi:uncharacterized protein